MLLFLLLLLVFSLIAAVVEFLRVLEDSSDFFFFMTRSISSRLFKSIFINSLLFSRVKADLFDNLRFSHCIGRKYHDLVF